MMCAHAYDVVHLWKSEDSFVELVLFFIFVSPTGFEPILPGLCSKHLTG